MLNIDRWYDRTVYGNISGAALAMLTIITILSGIFIGLAIIGQVGQYIYPPLISWMGQCHNIFSSKATFNSWGCQMFAGIIFILFVCFCAFLANVTLWPFYIWQRNNRNIIIGTVIGMFPFYLYGFELLGLVAAKITGDSTCNLNSYNELMHSGCLWPGVIVEFIIVGIEVGIIIIGATILTIKDCYNHGFQPAQDVPDDIVIDTDPQLMTGTIKN